MDEEVERRGVVAGAEHGNDFLPRIFPSLFRQPSDERQRRRRVLPEPAGLLRASRRGGRGRVQEEHAAGEVGGRGRDQRAKFADGGDDDGTTRSRR